MLGAIQVTGGFCPEARQFFARAGALDGRHKRAYDRMIRTLIRGGVWSTLDCFYVFATATSAAALTNIVRSSFTATATNSPTFTADAGYLAANSGDKYVDSNYNPSTQAINVTASSMAVGVWVTSFTANDRAAIGVNESSGTANSINIFPRLNADGKIYARINDQSDTAGTTIATAVGYSVGTRTGTSRFVYKNGGADIAGLGSSTAGTIQNNTLVIGVTRFDGSLAGTCYDGTIAAADMGGYRTQAQNQVMYDGLHQYLQTIAGIA